MTAKVHLLSIAVIDPDGSCDEEFIRQCLRSSRYISPTVVSYQARTFEWSDDHPLNTLPTRSAALADIFSDRKDIQ